MQKIKRKMEPVELRFESHRAMTTMYLVSDSCSCFYLLRVSTIQKKPFLDFISG